MDSTNAIIYLDIENDAPMIKFWYPYNLPEKYQKDIVEECVSIISGDPTFIPEVLLIFPISHLKIKVLIKYFKRKDTTTEEGISKSAIIFLFAEENDQRAKWDDRRINLRRNCEIAYNFMQFNSIFVF